MRNKPIRKILSLIFIFNLMFQQSGLAQMIGQLDIAKYLNQLNNLAVQDKFRPPHLRYFSYDTLTNNFEIFLDRGDLKDIKDNQLQEQGQELLKYFLIGISLPDESFWVNLRPDSESQIINLELAQTDLGKILLEADLQLKKDTAAFTSPETPEGREYWNKLYQKAGELFGVENVSIPTLTRPWIVPAEVIIRETNNSAYVYKATLKVMLEQDHLKNSTVYNFKDKRLKELNEYSSQLIREKILPKLTKEVNTSKKYASLRQVFYSLILSRWFKARFSGKSGSYPNLINQHNLNGLTSQKPWTKTTYFKEYQKSFSSGEYNIKEQVNTVMGSVIRTYFSGGIALRSELKMPGQDSSSPLATFRGRNQNVTIGLGRDMAALSGMPNAGQPLPRLTIMDTPQREVTSSPITTQINDALGKFDAVDWEKVIKPVEEGGEQFIYFFGTPDTTAGSAQMKAVLGGKGANLAEMAKLGLPVPFGYTQSTEITRYYFALEPIKDLLEKNPGLENKVSEEMKGRLAKAREIIAEFEAKQKQENAKYLKMLEERMGKKFGNPDNPLLVSVRSGAAVSMPGMMDTILNLGLNDTVVEGLAKLTQNPRFAWDAYRRFIQLYSKVVMGVEDLEKILDKKKETKGYEDDAQLTMEDLKELVVAYKEEIKRKRGEEFPQDPYEQLTRAILAVQESSITPRSLEYRRIENIELEDSFSAVNVQAMVFGNMGEDSGTGVAFTRDTATGKKGLNLEFLANAQGEDVVAGKRTGKFTEAELKGHLIFGAAFQELQVIQKKLENHYRDVQDIEFTVEEKTLWFLQTRSAKRTIRAAIVSAVDMVKEGLISKEEAIQRISNPSDLEILLNPQFDPKLVKAAKDTGKLITKGTNASPGAAIGRVVFTADEAVQWAKEGKKVILVRLETAPEDLHGMVAAQGILTARGGRTSHAAVVARQFGKPAVVGAGDITIDYENKTFSVKGKTYQEGNWISLDGATGEVIEGEISTIPSVIEQAQNIEGLQELKVVIGILKKWINKETDPSLQQQYKQFIKIYEEHLAKYQDVVLTPEDRNFYEQYKELLSWEKEFRKLGVAANAEQPLDVFSAVLNGAERIGLARTEHMFSAPGRVETVQEMILAPDAEPRQRALDKLLPFQQADFEQIFLMVKGRPVTMRLIDPPLHEFLPHITDTKRIDELAQRLGISVDKVTTRIKELEEENPMFGTRGVRLSVVMPEIIEMQARAIFNAARKVKTEGTEVHPEVMVPLVGNLQEYELAEKSIVKVANELGFARQEYLVGTMIEIIAGALTAYEIAQKAEFFSFGTNDLTQGAYKFSRDDAGAFVIPGYMEKGILPVDPFVSITPEVGEFLKMAVYWGRKANPNLKIGICGEQGLDAESIRNILSRVGLNYVSGGSRRIPIARLTAAQEALKNLPSVLEPVIEAKELPQEAALAQPVAEIKNEVDIYAQIKQAVEYVGRNTERRKEAIREALISLDMGKLFLDGKINIDLRQEEIRNNFVTILDWAWDIKDLKISFNADGGAQIEQGYKQEVKGIGLLSTEEVFLGRDFITGAQRAVLAFTDEKRDEALHRLLGQQQVYFASIFNQVINGERINIRLLDSEVAALFKGLNEREKDALAGELGVEKTRLEEMIFKLKEANPALGNRGIRLALTTHSKLYTNLLKAIFYAAAGQKKIGKNINLGILWPMVINAAEFKQAQEFTDKVAREVSQESGVEINYKVIPVIETPSGAITIQDIVPLSKEIVIDAKGLTEGVLGAFEADATKGFLDTYRRQGIWPGNPFQRIFEKNTGLLIREIIRRAKQVNPEVKVTSVGYGDNTPSIEFYQRARIDSVSVSPENISFAILAAAQAAIQFPRHASSSVVSGAELDTPNSAITPGVTVVRGSSSPLSMGRVTSPYGPHHPSQIGLKPLFERVAWARQDAPNHFRIKNIYAFKDQKHGMAPTDAISFGIVLEDDTVIIQNAPVMGGISAGEAEPGTHSSIDEAIAFFNTNVKQRLIGLNVARPDMITNAITSLDDEFRNTADDKEKPKFSYIGAELSIGISMITTIALAEMLHVPVEVVINYRYNEYAMTHGLADAVRLISIPVNYSVVWEGGKHGVAKSLPELIKEGVIRDNSRFSAKFSDPELIKKGDKSILLAMVPPQELQVIVFAPDWNQAREIGINLTQKYQALLKARGIKTKYGAESGFTTDQMRDKDGRLITLESVLEILEEAVASLRPEEAKYVRFALDIAASEMYIPEIDMYYIGPEAAGNSDGLVTNEEFTRYKIELFKKHPLFISVEDWADENRSEHWQGAKAVMGRMIQMGDDNTVSRADRIQQYTEAGVINAHLQKPNQSAEEEAGIEAVATSHALGNVVVGSHRGTRSPQEVYTALFMIAVGAFGGKWTLWGPGRSALIAVMTQAYTLYKEMGVQIPYQGALVLDPSGPYKDVDWAKRLRAEIAAAEVSVPEATRASSPLKSGAALRLPSEQANSASMPEAGVGGIDFRAITMITQPMGNLYGLNLSLPKLSNPENINLDDELVSIQKMLKAGIAPSGERLKEYVAACYQKGASGKYIDGIIDFLVDICRIQEEQISATPDDIKALLLIVDSI